MKMAMSGLTFTVLPISSTVIGFAPGVSGGRRGETDTSQSVISMGSPPPLTPPSPPPLHILTHPHPFIILLSLIPPLHLVIHPHPSISSFTLTPPSLHSPSPLHLPTLPRPSSPCSFLPLHLIIHPHPSIPPPSPLPSISSFTFTHPYPFTFSVSSLRFPPPPHTHAHTHSLHLTLHMSLLLQGLLDGLDLLGHSREHPLLQAVELIKAAPRSHLAETDKDSTHGLQGDKKSTSALAIRQQLCWGSGCTGHGLAVVSWKEAAITTMEPSNKLK